MKKKENTVMKWFTIFLIVVFLIWTFGTGAMVVLWGSNNQKIESNK